ncbi:MAG TPA: outer membrane beta-barrel protein, partial [Longimicrobium sp.]|nr:outer membrane beta-barrel protein [Longimicrobium sp.]
MRGIVRRMALAGLALAFGGAGAASAEAQADLLGPGAGFIAVGASGIATGELDDFLAERGYPTFGGTAVSVGFGGYRILQSGVMLGGEFNGLVIGEETHQGREVGLGGGSLTLGVGYAVDLSPRLRVYPRLGLGVGGMGQWIDRQDTVDFEEVLAGEASAPDRENVLSRDGPVVDLGAGAEFLPHGRRGPLIGVRAGYLAASFGSEWDAYEHAVIGGPE